MITYILNNELRAEIINDYDDVNQGQFFRSEYHSIIDNESILQFYDFYGERPMHDIVQNIKGRVHENGTPEEVEVILEKFNSRINDKINKIKDNLLTPLENKRYYSKEKIADKIKCTSKNNFYEICIPADKKQVILGELKEIYGINSATIYPDVEGYIQYLKNKFS